MRNRRLAPQNQLKRQRHVPASLVWDSFPKSPQPLGAPASKNKPDANSSHLIVERAPGLERGDDR